jgi:hypothetical protein
MTPDEDRHRNTASTVAIILAVGICISLNLVTLALLWAAYSRYVSGANIGISENGTQLLTTGWSGIISVLAAFTGYSFGKHKRRNDDEEQE